MARRQRQRRHLPSPQAAPRTLETLRTAIRDERRVAEVALEVIPQQVVAAGRGVHVEIHYDPSRVRTPSGDPASVTDQYVSGRVLVPQHNYWIGQVAQRDPDDPKLVLRIRVDPGSIVPGRPLRIFPFSHLAELERWARSIVRLPDSLTARARLTASTRRAIGPPGASSHARGGLRPSQRAAIDLADQPALLLWGPPGTGKTYTLGALIAEHLGQGRSVVALSTANVAVDQLTLAIDDACRRIGVPVDPGAIIRAGYPQLEALTQDPDRHHLLRWTQTLDDLAVRERDLNLQHRDLSKRRTGATSERERTEFNLQLAACDSQIEDLRKERRRILAALVGAARCVVTTTATYISNAIVHGRGYDVTAVDEASMVSGAVTLRLLHDERSHFCLAGDFRQLPPISLAAQRSAAAKAWLAVNAFDLLEVENDRIRDQLRRQKLLAMLTEQSRMPPEICELVSRMFYDGLLRTVGDPKPAPNLEHWPRERLVTVDPLQTELAAGSPAVTRRPTIDQGSGASWDRSAQLARQLTAHYLRYGPRGERIAVLTPYRQQAKLIRTLVQPLAPDRVTAGTIHTMQGSEADIVIFDPVSPGRWFLTASPQAPKLINVALTRARRQLILLGSPVDMLANPFLRRMQRDAQPWTPTLAR